MKLSDYVVKFLESNTDSIFLLSGGGIMHLVDSVGKSKLSSYCCQHEQVAVIAAEGYARIKNDVGVALVTTGPGGTNAITGIAGAWLDSIPVLIIAGQVKMDNITPRKKNIPVVRALGFQELNVIDLVKPITKYAVTVKNKSNIKYILEKAVYLAKSGRPGPVFVEIPLDIQAQEIEINSLRAFNKNEVKTPRYSSIPAKKIVKKLKEAKKPLLMVGNGIRLAGAENLLEKFINKTCINVVSAIFTSDDLVPSDYINYLGRQGMPGNYSANYAVDNCDLLIVIGEIIQLTQTSYDYKKFGKQAYKIMVDIDKEELFKKTLKIDLPIHADAKDFLSMMLSEKIKINKWDIIPKKINIDSFDSKKNYVNVYKLLDAINKCSKSYNVVTANGMASLSSHQALKMSSGQRFLTNAGLGHMGSGLPMAIGACIANNKKPVICMEGDGSLMLNIQDLQTVLHNRLPIKLFIFNNNGYFSIRNTHNRFFKRNFASDPGTGVSLPNYEKLITSWGFNYLKIKNNEDLDEIKTVIDSHGPFVCEVMIDPEQLMTQNWLAGSLRGKKYD